MLIVTYSGTAWDLDMAYFVGLCTAASSEQSLSVSSAKTDLTVWITNHWSGTIPKPWHQEPHIELHAQFMPTKVLASLIKATSLHCALPAPVLFLQGTFFSLTLNCITQAQGAKTHQIKQSQLSLSH